MLYSFDHQHIDPRPAAAPAELADEQLMEKIKHGDERALTLLHRRYHALLRTVIGRVVGNDHDVDELIQECLRRKTRASDRGTAEQPFAGL